MNESSTPLERVFAYHERTKHHLDRYAAGPDGLDWASQPDAFRHYKGAARIVLPQPEPWSRTPFFDAVVAGQVAPVSLSAGMISRLLYDALAISAWKVAGGSRWAVRCNPSSGNLHPTEAHLLLPRIDGIGARPGLYHYGVIDHALERRCEWTSDEWRGAVARLPASGFLVALTSIHWREAWKYGERAYRYCQHDVGHAMAQIAYAAAALGWHVRVLSAVSDDDIALMTGISAQTGEDGEHPDVLLLVSPEPVSCGVAASWVPPALMTTHRDRQALQGEPNRLGEGYREWPEIDRVAAAARRPRGFQAGQAEPAGPCGPDPRNGPARGQSARHLFRTRRSAVDMDGQTRLSRKDFGRIVRRLLPGRMVPWPVLPWRAAIHPVFLVHRVTGLDPGVYVLVRNPSRAQALRASLRGFTAWDAVDDLADGDAFVRLGAGDTRPFARKSNCHQDIAADGAFSVAMLADFERTLREEGPWAYRRLFWEAGMLGQVLYLEAEAAGLRGTGIGCFFDDVIHQAFGLADRTFQSLYGFTVGGPVDDPRIQLEPAYRAAEPAAAAVTMKARAAVSLAGPAAGTVQPARR